MDDPDVLLRGFGDTLPLGENPFNFPIYIPMPPMVAPHVPHPTSKHQAKITDTLTAFFAAGSATQAATRLGILEFLPSGMPKTFHSFGKNPNLLLAYTQDLPVVIRELAVVKNPVMLAQLISCRLSKFNTDFRISRSQLVLNPKKNVHDVIRNHIFTGSPRPHP